MDSSEITEATAVEVADHGDDHDHPSDNKYMQIAAILAVLTALEVDNLLVDQADAKEVQPCPQQSSSRKISRHCIAA